ncbi:MAG: Gfo/Idh/MocA family oxidoreductase [Planctomycetes bacterium]|nr:Gfo/Idh/MocA family oxidoreductase [Planctomycetota bacterium]
MTETQRATSSRRTFLKKTGLVAGASVLAGVAVPRVHAAEDNTIRVALVGCGGRGTGAAGNALSVENGPTRLVAMADVFPERLAGSYKQIEQRFADRTDVPEERRFVGFDGYRKAIDCLRPGDVVIMATPPAFRWVHFGYAIAKGVNVFMEKPVTVDGPTTARMLKLADQATEKNLKVAVGLMWRHCAARRELVDRVQQGEIGDVLMMRTYRLHGPIGFFAAPPKPEGISHLMYQIQRFHSFLWASGGCYSDFYIHNIDELCWMKGSWPVKSHATGGRHYRGDSLDQNFDNYSVEYTFADGTKLFMVGRCMVGCEPHFAGYAHGSKGLGTISSNTVGRGTCRTYKGHNAAKENLVWKAAPEPNPYQLEWNDLVDAIRNDKPYNEATRGAEASLVTSMGRMAAHTGKTVTYEEMASCDHEFAPGLDQFTADSTAPLGPDATGKYPVPQPGIVTNREY